MKNQMKKQFGISLLEVMLSLSIIAIILVMATRYFAITMQSEKTNEAVKILQTVVKASDDWYYTYKTYQKSANNPDISIAALINLGMVPKNYVETTANPWGGAIEISPRDANHVSIQLTEISSPACQNLISVVTTFGLKNALCSITSKDVDTFNANYP